MALNAAEANKHHAAAASDGVARHQPVHGFLDARVRRHAGRLGCDCRLLPDATRRGARRPARRAPRFAAAADIMSLPLLAGVAFLIGLGWSTDFPVRRTLVGDTVGPERLGNAMSFESATNSATRMIGPLIGGVTYQVFGLEAAYAIAAVVYGLTIIFSLGLAPSQPSRPARRRESLLSVSPWRYSPSPSHDDDTMVL